MLLLQSIGFTKKKIFNTLKNTVSINQTKQELNIKNVVKSIEKINLFLDDKKAKNIMCLNI